MTRSAREQKAFVMGLESAARICRKAGSNHMRIYVADNDPKKWPTNHPDFQRSNGARWAAEQIEYRVKRERRKAPKGPKR